MDIFGQSPTTTTTTTTPAAAAVEQDSAVVFGANSATNVTPNETLVGPIYTTSDAQHNALGYTIAASSNSVGFFPYMAFDLDTATFWNAAVDSFNSGPGIQNAHTNTPVTNIFIDGVSTPLKGSWIEMKIPQGSHNRVNQYVVKRREAASFDSFRPYQWHIIRKVGIGGNWVSIDLHTGLPPVDVDLTVTLAAPTVQDDANDVYYRMFITQAWNTDTGGGNTVQVASFRLVDTTLNDTTSTNVTTAAAALANINSLSVHNFEYISDPGVSHLGFVRGQLTAIKPELIDATTTPPSVVAGELIPMLVQSINELTLRVAALEV